MKIMVLLKKTPDTETKLVLDGEAINTNSVKFIINPYDEFAIEEALQIKSKVENGEVIVASFGDDGVKELLIKALAMGADRAIQVSNEGLEGIDSLQTAKILAALSKKENPDMILTGKQGIDDDNMHVQTMTAELLQWPHVNVIGKLTLEGTTAICEREVEGGQVEISKLTLPAVIGCNKSLNTPRYASLPGIMKAKRKPYQKLNVSDLGLDAAQLAQDSKVVVTGYLYPPEKPQGKIFQGEEVPQMIQKVVKLLREEAKVI